MGQPGATGAATEHAWACNPTSESLERFVYVEVWSGSPDPCNTYTLSYTLTSGCQTDTADTSGL